MKFPNNYILIPVFCLLALSANAIQVTLDLGNGSLETAELTMTQDPSGGPANHSGVVSFSDVQLVKDGSRLFISAKTADEVKISLGRAVCATLHKRLIVRSVTRMSGVGRVGSDGTVELKLNRETNEFNGFLVDEPEIISNIICRN